MEQSASSESTSNRSRKTPGKVKYYPSSRTTSVVKTSTLKHLPHEPMKGATGPMSTEAHGQSSTDICSTGSTSQNRNRPPGMATDKIERSSQPRDDSHLERRQLELSSSLSRQLEENKLLPASVSLQTLSLESNHGYNYSRDGNAVQFYSGLRDGMTVDSRSRRSAGVIQVDRQTSTDSPEYFTFTKKSEKFTSSRDLETQVSTLKEQLEVQSKVNTDLKKLLVASIGDDLHYKVDALVRTKVQLANEIGDYTRKLVEDYEDLDKLSIQADLWHSKYKASKVLVEQLTTERERLGDICMQGQAAIQHMFFERQELYQLLAYLHRNLKSLQAAFAPSSQVDKGVDLQGGLDTVELARSNKVLADRVCSALLGSRPVQTPVLTCNLSPAENMACQVLSASSFHAPSNSCSHGPSSHSFARFHPGARYDGVTYNCCAKCKGEVQAV